MSSGAWVRTAADAVTAVAAAAGAGVGGVWAFFRYRRQEPDQPRLNLSVAAKLIQQGSAWYLAVDLEVRHIAGSTLKIEHDDVYDPGHPTLEITRVEDGVNDARDSPAPLAETREVFAGQTELGSGEIIADHKIVLVGEGTVTAIGFETSFLLTGTWNSQSWTWSANALVLMAGGIAASTAESATITRGSTRS